MNTFQLSCFLSVAQHLNFARAAEELNITQPAVTHQIQTLEEELNVKLFHRTTRTVEITTEGKVFLDDAKQILRLSVRAKKRFEYPDKRKVLPFSIACHYYCEVFSLTGIMKKMRQTFPNLYPRIQIVPFRHIYKLLADENVDAVINFQEPDTKKIPGTYKQLAKVRLNCICAKDSPLATRKSITTADLSKEKLILNDPDKSPDSVVRLQGSLMAGRSPADFLFSDSTEAALMLAEAGFGVTLLPNIFVPPTPGFASIPVEDFDAFSFGIYYKTLKGNPCLKEFITLLKEELSAAE